MDYTTLYNAIFLMIITTIIIYVILYSYNPSFLLDRDKKFKQFNAFIYSAFVSTIFSTLIAFLSIYIDNINMRRSKKH